MYTKQLDIRFTYSRSECTFFYQEWWTHLWLNEGFASFMEYLATDHCHPKFDIWTQFVSHDYMRCVL